MNAKDIVILVCEKKAPAPYWTGAKGVYADLSDWPRSIDYYAKCPKCGHVHGHYRTLADAHSKKLCPLCDYESTEKLKKEVRKLTYPASALREAGGLPPSAPEPFDPDAPISAKDAFKGVARTWIELAHFQLEEVLKETLVLDPDGDPDFNADFPDDAIKIVFAVQGSDNVRYNVWRTEELAEAEALSQVENDFESEPSAYADFLQNYVDLDKVRETLTPDEERSAREQFDEEHSDYEEKVQAMLDAGKIDSDVFCKKNGDLKKETPALERLADAAVDEWVTETVAERLSDPVDYLKDMGYGDGGKDPYSGRKIDSLFDVLQRWGGLDYKQAARDAVNNDGWPHTLARYDGNSISLPGGAVAVRE